VAPGWRRSNIEGFQYFARAQVSEMMTDRSFCNFLPDPAEVAGRNLE
jgi:hypothetical protein